MKKKVNVSCVRHNSDKKRMQKPFQVVTGHEERIHVKEIAGKGSFKTVMHHECADRTLKSCYVLLRQK
jgi:hypothetical protein